MCNPPQSYQLSPGSSSIEERAAAECERGETAAAEHQPLVSSGRRSGHHLSRSCALLIRKYLSVRECRFQTLATGLECLELSQHAVSLDRQLAAARLAQLLGPR